MEPVRDARHMLVNAEFRGQAAGDVSEHKKSHFEVGTVKKSKFERDKEAAERKKQEQEAEMARAYEDFAEFFGGADDDGRSSSSRFGSGGGGRAASSRGFVKAGGSDRYNPLADRPASTSTRPTAARLMMDEGDSVSAQSAAALSNQKKKRDMDKFLEELKRDQRDREERLARTADQYGSSVTALAAREFGPTVTGSFDVSDSSTTNVHVGNLPSSVTERDLGMYFARYGPVGSVKIMWPRPDGPPIPASKRSLGGFVAFMRRPDAEHAVKDADGKVWQGEPLRLSWGKSVPVPSRAMYEVEPSELLHSRKRRRRSLSRSRSRSRSPSGHSSSHHRDRHESSRRRTPPRDERAWPTLEEDADEGLIREVARRIREYGHEYEEIVREKERHNRKFDFLRYDKLPSYHYFRMLMDSKYIPPTVMQVESFEDEGDGDMYSTDSAEEDERQSVRKGLLGKRAKHRFECILRGLTSTREKIARGMAFALDHADAAPLVVDLIIASLLVHSTPVPRKIARLHLVSDILHNSSATIPNAWTYRSTLESRLPIVFDHLGEIYQSFPGRMKAEQFKMQVDAVSSFLSLQTSYNAKRRTEQWRKILDVWDRDWIVFEPGVIEDLRNRLVGAGRSNSQDPPSLADQRQRHRDTNSASLEPNSQSVEVDNETANEAARKTGFKKGAFKAATFVEASLEPDPVEQDVTTVSGPGVEATSAGAVSESGVPAADLAQDEGVDGAAVEDDVDGEPIDVDGAPVTLSDDEDVDGMPVALPTQDDDEVDGQPVDLDGGKPTRAESDEDMFQ